MITFLKILFIYFRDRVSVSRERSRGREISRLSPEGRALGRALSHSPQIMT